MGSPAAPNYANLFMGKFVLDRICNPYSNFIKSYWRYIDELFLIWSGNMKYLKSSLIN